MKSKQLFVQKYEFLRQKKKQQGKWDFKLLFKQCSSLKIWYQFSWSDLLYQQKYYLISIFITSNHRFFSATLNSLWRFRAQTVITFKYHVTFFLILKCQWQRNGCITQKLTFNVELSEGWLVKKVERVLSLPLLLFFEL